MDPVKTVEEIINEIGKTTDEWIDAMLKSCEEYKKSHETTD